jgi:hypothetical protein
MLRLALSLGFAAVIFIAACEKKDLAESPTEKENTASGAEKQIEIDWLLPELAEGEETPWLREVIERQFNVAITPVWMDSFDFLLNDIPIYSPTHYSYGLSDVYQAEHPLEILPDCGILRANAFDAYKLGWSRAVPKEMIRTYMPGYSQLLDEKYPWGWTLMSNRGRDQKECLYLYLPEVRDQLPHQVIATRIDWARAVGIEFPDYEDSKIRISDELPIYWLDADITVEWWEKLLKAFRDGDPDGNGEIDTVPWPASNRY